MGYGHVRGENNVMSYASLEKVATCYGGLRGISFLKIQRLYLLE